MIERIVASIMGRKAFLCFVTLAVMFSACGNEVQKRDSINISVPYELDSLDPHARAWLSASAILSNFYEPLVFTAADLKIQPCLAQRWENPDVYTWLFHLQPSVQFHDGRTLRAEDVVYSYQRLLKSKDLEISSYLTDVTEVSAVDALTVMIRTGSPLAILLNKLSNVFIIPRGSISQNLSERVDGTGPYKLEMWSKGSMIRIVRNEDYWRKKAALKTVEYYLNRTPAQVVEDLKTGKCQLGQYDSKKFEEVVSGLKRYQVLRQDNFFLKYLSYDVSRETTPYCKERSNPFKNPLVRKAIHLGISRDRLVAELPTYAVPASQPVPAFVFGFNPAISLPAVNPAEARRLLAQAGYPNGFDVTLHERQILQNTGLLLKEQLKQIGIRVDLKAMPDLDFFHALDAGDFSFFLSRVGATVGDASDVFEPQFHSKDPSKHYGIRNYGGYVNADVDRSIEESAKILKPEERNTMLQTIMSTLMVDLPWIPLYIDQDVYALDRQFTWTPRPDSYVRAYDIGVR
jgi:peptide/nickel transport system substrate-binding protein